MTDIPAEAFLNVFRQEAAASHGRLSFEHFMRLALFSPEAGYYTAHRKRVGREAGTDFYTSSNIGAGLFGELVASACNKLLLEKGLSPEEFTFVEVGAETDHGVLAGVRHPFAASKTLRLGEKLLLSGRCVVFSNELFDAQPCRRFKRTAASWIELGVQESDGTLSDCELAPVAASWLPASAPEGYIFDAPLAAAELASQLAQQDWSGLFLAFDYGRTFAALSEEHPSGTLRAYYQHRQVKELLARPGEQDLTCHICWDWLSEALARAGAAGIELQSQESFLVHHAGSFIGEALAQAGGGFSPRKQSLLQLLHPAHLGQKFQAFRAWK